MVICSWKYVIVCHFSQTNWKRLHSDICKSKTNKIIVEINSFPCSQVHTANSSQHNVYEPLGQFLTKTYTWTL